jgi:hypothetical protein
MHQRISLLTLMNKVLDAVRSRSITPLSAIVLGRRPTQARVSACVGMFQDRWLIFGLAGTITIRATPPCATFEGWDLHSRPFLGFPQPDVTSDLVHRPSTVQS